MNDIESSAMANHTVQGPKLPSGDRIQGSVSEAAWREWLEMTEKLPKSTMIEGAVRMIYRLGPDCWPLILLFAQHEEPAHHYVESLLKRIDQMIRQALESRLRAVEILAKAAPAPGPRIGEAIAQSKPKVRRRRGAKGK
ncbi:MAG: hypothetical protein A2Y76_01520 [Planctomycetes bacterium RBG_13_60_9]|nr:MAG: hypothetical protein A2Y76_01520 [Planctomycetes bacterium RBG_13_60_9]